jgi:hypothetical protein
MTEYNQNEWDAQALEKYQAMLGKIPLFHRQITKEVVDKQAVINARERGADTVEEQDILRSFFADVPKAFYSLMIRLMDDVGFDYQAFESGEKAKADAAGKRPESK